MSLSKGLDFETWVWRRGTALAAGGTAAVFGEASLYPSQPSQARTMPSARELGMEQLSPLRDRNRETRGD